MDIQNAVGMVPPTGGVLRAGVTEEGTATSTVPWNEYVFWPDYFRSFSAPWQLTSTYECYEKPPISYLVTRMRITSRFMSVLTCGTLEQCAIQVWLDANNIDSKENATHHLNRSAKLKSLIFVVEFIEKRYILLCLFGLSRPYRPWKA